MLCCAAFFLPHGVRIIQRLQTLLRREYHLNGYQEVMTPLVFEKALWQKSGHYDHYREDMFFLHEGGKAPAAAAGSACGHAYDAEPAHHERGLKPMNCPGHCLVFANTQVSGRSGGNGGGGGSDPL